MRPYYAFMQWLCKLSFVSGWGGRVLGRAHVPRSGGAVLIANHQSFLDPMLVGLALPRECHFMARDTLFRHPWFSRLISSLNAFPVKRGSADVGALKEATRRLQAGGLVVTFPESTRTLDGSIGAFQPGIVLMARRAGVPIVPAVIHGAFEAWPRNRKWPRLGHVTVCFGPGLSAHEVKAMPPEAVLAELRGRMFRMYDACNARARSA